MRHFCKIVSTTAIFATTIGALFLAPNIVFADSHKSGSSKSVIEEGKAIAFNRKKGNCLACHQIAGGNLPGNIAPPLVAMKQRFPDKAKLKSQIYDATVVNPNSIMPPFGSHRILSEEEINKVVEFIHQL